jgi:hypothetical protein
LEIVNNDIQYQLDLIHFLKRIRMHGKALSYKLNKNERAFMGSISKKKPVNVAEKVIESDSNKENSDDCDM